ncbi:MAG TPA: hypothetical protein VFY93_11640 [Planctomycetota bacterium]|nr:hypothetical protein [Planctomycetota bacterium]
MSRRPRSPLLLLLVAACARPEPRETSEAPPPEGPAAPAPASPAAAEPGLPFGFEVKGAPEVRAPFLPPASTWRWLVSGLRLHQAEGKEILVTFEEGAFHTTDRAGRRLTYRLPEGLRLTGTPVHVLLKADLGLEIWGASGAQVVGEEEVTVVTARIDMGGGNVQEFRLVAKGGIGFRSISTGGEAG